MNDHIPAIGQMVHGSMFSMTPNRTTQMNEPTPRTDAFFASTLKRNPEAVRDFARNFERQLLALKQERVKERKYLSDQALRAETECSRLKRQLDMRSPRWSKGLSAPLPYPEEKAEVETCELEQSLARVTAERDELQTERDWLKKQLAEVIKERDGLEELKAILTDDELAALCRKLKAERDRLVAEKESIRLAMLRTEDGMRQVEEEQVKHLADEQGRYIELWSRACDQACSLFEINALEVLEGATEEETSLGAILRIAKSKPTAALAQNEKLRKALEPLLNGNYLEHRSGCGRIVNPMNRCQCGLNDIWKAINAALSEQGKGGES